MSHTISMSLVEGISDLHRKLQRLIQRQPSSFETACERLAFQELHYQEIGFLVTADVINNTNVGMMEPGNGSRLACESGACFGLFRDVLQKHFHGDLAVEPRITSSIDFS